MPFLPNFKKTKKRTGRSAEPNAIASQVEAMNMYKRTGEATASGSAAPAHADDEDTGGIGSVDSSTLNNARAARRGAGGVITTTASSHDRDNDNKKKRRRLNDGDDDDADHDTLSHASNTKRQRSNLLQSKGGGSDYHSPLVSSKIPSPGIGRDASPMYSPPEVDHHSSALTIRHDDSLDRKTDLDGGWACDNCWNLNEAQAERCSSCNQLQKTDQKSPPRKKSAEDSKEADEIARVESSSLSTNRSRKVKVPRRITGEVPALKKLKKIELKPDLRVGDEVWAAWWENRGEGEVCQAESGGWYPGRIKRVREQGGSDYGPQRYYDIEYDDGDELHGVDDVYVVRKEDYELSTRENVARWKGIALETDDNSTDLWAKRMGWYSVTIDGDDYRFPYLSQALRAYDDSVVRSKGVNTYPSDLNLAEEWKFSKRIRKQDAREKDARTEEIARRLKGCSFNEAYGRYSAQISFSGVEKVTKNIGFYELKADAAFAYDEAAKKLGVAASRGLNYSSPDEHLDVRNREMEKRGISVNIATVKAKVADKTKDYKPADVKKKSDSTASSSDGTRKKKKEKKKKTPASKYELVTFNAGNNVFDTRIVDPASGRRIFLGSYEYASDAALAADLGIRHLRANNSIVNFASVDEYHKAKKEEAAINPGKCSFTVADINSRVHAALKSKKKSPAKNGPKSKPKSTANQAAKTNPPCPHVDPIYDALETKWGKHLDKKTGREFMSDYQHFIQDSMRGLEACDSIKRSRSSHEGGAPIINDPFSNDPNAAQLPTVRTVQTATEEDVARDNPRKSFKPESPSKKEAPTFRTLFRKLSSGNASEKGSPSSESRKVTPKSFGSEHSSASNVPKKPTKKVSKRVSFQSMPNIPFPETIPQQIPDMPAAPYDVQRASGGKNIALAEETQVSQNTIQEPGVPSILLQQSSNASQAIFSIQGQGACCNEQPSVSKKSGQIQNLGGARPSNKGLPTSRRSPPPKGATRAASRHTSPSSKGLPPSRWSPPPLGAGAARAATRHTKNYPEWKLSRRPGDRDTIKVEVWKSVLGVPYRPNEITFRDAYWCPWRNQYCYTRPADYLAQIRKAHATKRSRADRDGESIDEATKVSRQRLYRYN